MSELVIPPVVLEFLFRVIDRAMEELEAERAGEASAAVAGAATGDAAAAPANAGPVTAAPAKPSPAIEPEVKP